MHTKEQLISDMRALGINPGDTVLMHSSFRSLGGIEGGAASFYEGFLELLGEDGTLVIPTLSYGTVTRDAPVFDRNETPSCVGYLSEYFRTSVPGVIRSMHATHSCAAVGRLAEEITKNHELDLTPVGPNSPFSKLPKFNGKILMLGCSFDSNTSFHGIEETAEPPYLFDRSAPIHYTLKDGERVIEQEALRHHFVLGGVHPRQQYSRVIPLLSEDEVSFGKVLDASCALMDAKAVWEKGQAKLLEDPFYFVEIPI
ncbi:MAG: AAC(3) family N-acetyltransferase [Clostridia bacterium]|nr:AAC(3) family N-acetyltransferase [Clostridia bacterium]